jgi:hypothetical protein
MNKFHQSYKYTDTKMGMVIEFNISVVHNRVIGKMKTSHPKYPTVTTVFDGLEPKGMKEIEDGLLEMEKQNLIKGLSFGREMCVTEVNNKCIEIPIN